MKKYSYLLLPILALSFCFFTLYADFNQEEQPEEEVIEEESPYMKSEKEVSE